MITLGTETADGFVRHLRVHHDAGIIDAPVKLRSAAPGERSNGRIAVNRESLPFPLRRGAAYAYALPGGGEIVI